jgi:hypothetical protein
MIWVRSKYDYSKTLAVMANGEDGSPYGVATVYLEGQSEKLPEDCAFVDTNNWPYVDKLLIDEGLAEKIETVGQSGFCVYPEMKFNLDKIKELK